MTVVYVVLGILVGVGMAFVLPWALLRKLEAEDQGGEGEGGEDEQGPKAK